MTRRDSNGNIKHPSGLTIRDADLSRAEPVRWAWQHRILRGYINLLIGEEGIGKSTLVAWLAARITRGELAGDLHGTPSKVAFVGDEDSWDHIWVPKLEAAGANTKMTKQIVHGLDDDVIDLKRDAKSLMSYLSSEGIALVYFDQLLDNLGVTDDWKAKQVREALAPLRRAARVSNCGVLCTMHPNKRGGSFRDRVQGTPAFNALSRSSMLLAPHPTEPGRVVAAVAKANYMTEPDAFGFVIKQTSVPGKGGVVVPTTEVRDTCELPALRARDLLAEQKRETATDQARARLEGIFADGGIHPANDVLETMLAEDFSKTAIHTARRSLKIQTWQGTNEGAAPPWYWGYESSRKLSMNGNRAEDAEVEGESTDA